MKTPSALALLPLFISVAIGAISSTCAAVAANPSAEPRWSTPTTTTAEYKTYVNDRFDYQIKYPADLLTAQGEPANSDGQRFVSKKGDAELRVWGNYKVAGDLAYELKLAKQADSGEKSKKKVIYEARDKNWFAVSGTDGDRIFYQKTCLRNDTFRSMTFNYPQSAKTQFAPVVDKVVASFKWCPK
jgi:hypothetical protein